MPVIRGFLDFEAYQRSKREAKKVFVVSKRFPRDERFSLTDQVRRSSRATGSMVAEAWARRRYPAAFVSKLTEALGEAMETQAWLDHALECEFISRQEFTALDSAWQEVGAMLNGMIEKADAFCPSGTRRSTARLSSILYPLPSILHPLPVHCAHDLATAWPLRRPRLPRHLRRLGDRGVDVGRHR